MGRMAARTSAQPKAAPRCHSSRVVARAGSALVARRVLRRVRVVLRGIAGGGRTGGDPAQSGEAGEQEKEEEGLLQEVGDDGEIEADGEALGGALGEASGSDDPEACDEEEQEVEGGAEG